MKLNFRLGLLLTLATLFTFTAFGQDLELPNKSTRSTISYAIGYTDITVDFSAPLVNGRTIFGDVLPYDQIWRAGANAATTVEFSTEVALGRERVRVPAGKYSLLIIPKEEGPWVVIFNKNTELRGTSNYSEEEDVARLEVTPRRFKAERLKFDIEDQGLDRGYISLGWADKRLIIFVRNDALKDMQAKVEAAVEAAADDAAKASIYGSAADVLNYLDDKRGSQALGMIEKAIELNASPRYYWTKALIHETKKEAEAAVEAAKKAQELGDADAEDNWYKNYKSTIAKNIEKWGKMKK